MQGIIGYACIAQLCVDIATGVLEVPATLLVYHLFVV